jgi:NAD(P)-dependent dehydrogenase (short-subunit alcohol dehydrogenase family)
VCGELVRVTRRKPLARNSVSAGATSGCAGMVAGVIDTGAWDGLGDDGKRDYFKHIAAGNPAGRIGTSEDVADAVLFAMTNTFITGMTLKVDGGEPLI